MFQNTVGGTQEMVLYFATEAVTNVTVEIPALGYSRTYSNIPANSIFTSERLPKNGPQDARLTQEGVSNKGVHITSDKPIVAYAHIYNGNVSGATLLFPTATLGKEYYSINFAQNSNEPNSNSFFYAVATDTGTTTIEVVPSASTQNMVAGNTYTFNLTQGQVFNALGVAGANTGVDLTGSRIRSISTASGVCKRIAVFSGSGKINITCPAGNVNASADNYMVQAFPKNAWGKYYLTAPTSRMTNNYFRVAVSDPTTVVRLNGTVLTGLTSNFYYQFGETNTPNVIEADKPIMVAQYVTSAGECGNNAGSNTGDPEVIYLSPVEQNIDRVIVNSTGNFSISQHFVNLIIPNRGTALSSLRIDGSALSGTVTVHPQNPAYSYLIQNVSEGPHTISSDSGFNAIAYGYGPAESYGYNAGANVKDLYQFLSIRNEYETVNFPAACRNSPFLFSMTFPYQPVSIRWQFGGLFPDVQVSTPIADSTWSVNGRQLYLYRLPTRYTTTAAPGSYPIKIFAQSTSADGCSGEQEISFDLQVFDRPVADFSMTAGNCVPVTASFTDNSTGGGRTLTRWEWDFGGGNTASLANPTQLFSTGGDFPIKHTVISDIGCISDTTRKTLALGQPPAAGFSAPAPYCLGNAVTFTDASTTTVGTLARWSWNFGDGTPVVIATSNAPQSHTYATAGAYTVTLKVETAQGCASPEFSQQITVGPRPAAEFSLPQNCLGDAVSQFTDNSTIPDGSAGSFTYLWDFGDGNATVANPNTSTVKNPGHTYTAAGSYTVSLTVTSDKGCQSTITKPFFVNGSQPLSAFVISTNPACSGAPVSITDNSSVDIGKLIRLEIYWNYSGDPTDRTTVNAPVAGTVYTHSYPEFFSPATRDFEIRVVAYSGDVCLNTSVKTLTLNASPQLQFAPVAGVCADAAPFLITTASNTNGLTGTGTFSGPGVSGAGLFNPAVAGNGVHRLRYNWQGDNGCNDFVEQTVPVFTVPVVSAGPDRVVLEGGSVVLLGTATGSNPSYSWSPAVGLTNPSIAQPSASLTADQVYRLDVLTADGCEGSDEVVVKLLKSLKIPNTFSPNGDGVHDRWVIEYLESYPGAIVEVFNRYGQPVFRSVNYGTAWDGTFKGAPLPAGTYYYIIQPKNGRPQIAGYVDIIR